MRRMILMFAASTLLGCFFRATDAEGLDCFEDDQCGPKLECIEGTCQKPGGGDGASSGADAGTTVPVGDDGSGDGGGCQWTNDGVCDEPNICPPGTDVADCEGADTAPACTDPGGVCEVGDCCGDGLCINFENVGSLCADQCTLGDDCESCCCGQTDAGSHVCAPSTFCEGFTSECIPGVCGLGGSPCFSNSDCCNGLCLEDQSGSFTCFKTCSSPSDCPQSGCCSNGVCQGDFVCA